MMSIRTIAISRRLFDQLNRLAAGGRRQHLHAAAFQHARQRKDVARVVIYQEHGSSHQILVGAVEPLQHALLFGRQIADDAMQEERGLIEQPFRRFNAFDHDAACHGVKLGILFRATVRGR